MAKTKKNSKEKAKTLDDVMFQPMMISTASDSATVSDTTTSRTGTRRNIAGSQERTDRFRNIDEGLVPFNYATNYNYNKSLIDIRDAVILCQKAYYNFGLYRNTIDLMTELSWGKIHLQGGTDKSRTFFKALFNKINLDSFQSRFYREYYRSGNVFIYRYETLIKDSDINKINQVYAASKSSKVYLPSRYIIINPADIQVNGNLSFNRGTYYKVLTDYELEAIRNPRTEEDKEILNTLPQSVKDQMQKKKSTAILLELDTKKIYAIFHNKQDYEPFAVPFGYPVLEDINAKIEMRRIDMAISRTVQQAVLLITMGTEPEKGGVNGANLAIMQDLFKNQSVGRVLVSDYTTKAEFIIPQIAEILDPKKYEIIDKDIAVGLNNVIIGNEKFANVQTKINVFVTKLQQARNVFINEFLLQEIKRISKDIGFKSFPTPFYEDIELKDSSGLQRVYLRMIELGVLTADEGIRAIETGILPTPDESLISQNEYKAARNKDLYQPLIGAPKDPAAGMNGRPQGKGTKQTTKKVSPIGTSKAEEVTFSAKNLMEVAKEASKLENEIQAFLKKKHKIKKLNEAQLECASELSKIIIANEDRVNWKNKIEEYVESPIDRNPERIEEIREIAVSHDTDFYGATLLYHSKI